MAVIRKRGDYQWQVIVRKKGFPPKSKTFIYQKDAETWARSVESEMERGSWLNNSMLRHFSLAFIGFSRQGINSASC